MSIKWRPDSDRPKLGLKLETLQLSCVVAGNEAALALGATPAVTLAPYVQSALHASLLPRLDMLRSRGLVWIPGVVAGMMVSGANPIYAGVYQFIIVAMILVASGLLH
jgi:putative ABC transport system permease protein